MRTIKKFIFSLTVAFAATSSAYAVTPQEADSAYNHEEFTKAIALYTDLLYSEGPNPELYYNLGNAHYRAGHTAQAVLACERALRLNPSHTDARTNLDFVNSRLEDKPADNRSFLSLAHQGMVESMSANAWAWTAFVLFVLCCSSLALYIFSGGVMMRKVGFFGAIVLAIVTIYSIFVAADAASRRNSHNEAIVAVPGTLLNSVPRQPKQTDKVVPLHEGTKIEIIDSVSTPDDPVSPRWYKISINGSSAAWVRSTDVERI